MTDAEMNEQTLKLLGWRWEPLPGKNAGGELITPSGTRYHWYVNEVDAWSKAPQVATDWCEAGKMLRKYGYTVHHISNDENDDNPFEYLVKIFGGELDDVGFKSTADTFPRAACLAVCAMLEAESNSVEITGDVS